MSSNNPGPQFAKVMASFALLVVLTILFLYAVNTGVIK